MACAQDDQAAPASPASVTTCRASPVKISDMRARLPYRSATSRSTGSRRASLSPSSFARAASAAFKNGSCVKAAAAARAKEEGDIRRLQERLVRGQLAERVAIAGGGEA